MYIASNRYTIMKKIALFTTTAFVLSAFHAHAAIIANGNFNTAVSQNSSFAGNSEFTLNTTTFDVEEDGSDTGVNAGEWVWTNLTRGFEYSGTGGDTGEGGALVNYSGGDSFNQKPRGVAQFSNDGSATTGSQTISMDVFMDDNTASNALSFIVELYAWNSGDTGPLLSLGGATANDSSYNVTTLGDATTILNTIVTAASVSDAAWDTVTLGSVDLGTGYDYYAWRIGAMGQTDGDAYAFDNISVVSAIPEPSAIVLFSIAGVMLLLLRRRVA